jgi:hypothetical protein
VLNTSFSSMAIVQMAIARYANTIVKKSTPSVRVSA